MGGDTAKVLCILIVNGHAMYREAMSTLLSRILPDAVIFEEYETAELDPAFNAGHLDLIMLCVVSPYRMSLDRLLELRCRFPSTPVIVFSDNKSSKIIQLARIFGACGFIHVSDTADDLLARIGDVLAGRLSFANEGEWFEGRAGHVLSPRMDFKLSPRQAEVFELLCRGMTNKEIAIRLGMSSNTVRTHVAAIFSILDVRNRTEAAAMGDVIYG
jgi:DNA-binding NarL/FixJ family response regulator